MLLLELATIPKAEQYGSEKPVHQTLPTEFWNSVSTDTHDYKGHTENSKSTNAGT